MSDGPRELTAIDYDKSSGKWSTRKMTMEEEQKYHAWKLREEVRQCVTVENARILAAVLAEVARQDAKGEKSLAFESMGYDDEIWRAARHIREALRLNKEGA